jgi:LuxR family maltose regulon positive regulatory protein
MNTNLTYTSILLPRRRVDLLTRQRLLDLLYDFLEYKLILVVAPAGYGKTSLLVDFARKADLPVCWYALDRQDASLPRFLAHLIAAIRHQYPDFGPASVSRLENVSREGLDVNQFITVLVNELYETISDHFILVLDDYHLVRDNPEIAAFISRFVQRANENCHLVIASRKKPEIPDVDLMVARSQVGALGAEELAFKADEIQSLVLQNYHLSVSEAQAEELARETEGWITGLLLSTQPSWKGTVDHLRAARASGVNLYDYLARQILDHQPASIRDFLLRTSLLIEFNVDLCQAVLEPSVYPDGADWSTLIQSVLKDNLFVLQVGEEDTWLRYHNLFRNFLQDQLEREHPEEKEPILRQLAN